jgi:hypothetical protein
MELYRVPDDEAEQSVKPKANKTGCLHSRGRNGTSDTGFLPAYPDSEFATRHPVSSYLQHGRDCNHFGGNQNSTIAAVGSKSIYINAPSNLLVRATVILAVSLSGTTLRPLVVFKRTANGRTARELRNLPEGHPRTLQYAVQDKAWCGQRIMKVWIEECLRQPLFHPK